MSHHQVKRQNIRNRVLFFPAMWFRGFGIVVFWFLSNLPRESNAVYAQPSAYRLEPVSLEQGVSHNLIYCIKQDRQGFLWFGTMLGLVKYDGYTYTTYRHDPQDSTSLSNDDILAVYEDRQQNLWVGTYGGGLNMLERATGKFVRYMHSALDSTSLGNNIIWAVTEDRCGAIWVATNGGGLSAYPKTRC